MIALNAFLVALTLAVGASAVLLVRPVLPAAYVAAVLIGLLILGHAAIAARMRRIRRTQAISPEAARLRRIFAAYDLGPHHGTDFEPWGLLFFDRAARRHRLVEFSERADAEAAHARIRHDADVLAVLMHQADGNWAVAK